MSDEITNLANHPRPHVTVSALARYWHVDVRTIGKWIDAELLTVIRFPNGVTRVSVFEALAFESRQHQPTSHASRSISTASA